MTIPEEETASPGRNRVKSGRSRNLSVSSDYEVCEGDEGDQPWTAQDFSEGELTQEKAEISAQRPEWLEKQNLFSRKLKMLEATRLVRCTIH